MAEVIEPRVFDTGTAHGRAMLAEPPRMWSYSSLKDVEVCPLRYALARADYPDLWDQHGYPHLPIPAAIRGDVVHGSLEIIVKAFAKAGCTSTRSSDAVAVLRGLNGYSAVAEGVLSAQLARFDGNPRLNDDRREQLKRALLDWVPEAREQIQTYLGRMELQVRAPAAPAACDPDVSERPLRYPARPGDHPERDLVADALRLRGRIDLLSVGEDEVAITDFKTGVEDPAHHDQLRLYALLWTDDHLVNPDGLAVTGLVAAYPSHDVAVPVPTEGELGDLRTEITMRVGAAENAILHDPPAAHVGEQCDICSVRGLCSGYWSERAPETSNVRDGDWYDLQGTVVREHGVKSWVVRETQSGKDVLVRTPTPSFTLSVGSDVRLLGARRTVDPDEEDALVASLTSASEVLEMTG